MVCWWLLNSNVQVHFRFSLCKVYGVQNSTASSFPKHPVFPCQLPLHRCSILHLLPEANTTGLFEAAVWRDSNPPQSYKSNTLLCTILIFHLLHKPQNFFFSALQPWVGLGLLNDPPPLIPITRLLHPSTNSHSS